MDKERIRTLRNEGKTYVEIGKLYGVTRQRIEQICKGINGGTKLKYPSPEERKEVILKGLREQLTK